MQKLVTIIETIVLSKCVFLLSPSKHTKYTLRLWDYIENR